MSEDVAQLPRAVDVHDGHDGDAQQARGPEGHGRLGPVGVLVGDDVTRTQAAAGQSTGEAAGPLGDLPDRPVVWARVGEDAEPDGRVLACAPVEERADGDVQPRAFALPADGEIVRDRA